MVTNFEDFALEFGYTIETLKEAKRDFNSCKKQYERLHKIFNQEEIETLQNELEELGY